MSKTGKNQNILFVTTDSCLEESISIKKKDIFTLLFIKFFFEIIKKYMEGCSQRYSIVRS